MRREEIELGRSTEPPSSEATRVLPDVTIVIVNWNTRDLLDECLRSVQSHVTGCRLETIVVDNASSDGSPELVRERFPWARLVINRENRGFSAGVNQGIERSRGRYVLLLNSDTVLIEDAVSRSAAFADSQPDIGVVGCKILYPDYRFQSSTFRFPSVWGIFTRVSGLSRAFPESALLNFERYGQREWKEPRQCDVVMGSFMLVRREAIERAGLLDESYFMYGEETEWCHRIRQCGLRTVYYPETSILHVHRGSAKTEKQRWAAHTAVERSHVLFLLSKRGRIPAALGAFLYASGECLRATVVAIRATVRRRPAELPEARARLAVSREILALLPRIAAIGRRGARHASPPPRELSRS